MIRRFQNIITYSAYVLTCALTSLVLTLGNSAEALTASKVFFEFWPQKSMYRVRVHYTIPELKEAREARVEFRSKRKAEKYYFALLKGAEFYLQDPKNLRFENPALKQDPW
ncbi:hypothetical protein N9W79_00145 [bacterium]|nr:hypothetical protein [bacterium]